jgi:hypothetical protein
LRVDQSPSLGEELGLELRDLLQIELVNQLFDAELFGRGGGGEANGASMLFGITIEGSERLRQKMSKYSLMLMVAPHSRTYSLYSASTSAL